MSKRTRARKSHTHARSYSYVPHPNVPWGALVLSPVINLRDNSGPRRVREATGRYVTLSSVTEINKKRKRGGWYKSDKDSRQNHRLFYLRLWHYIPRHIMLIDRLIFCPWDTQHNTTMVLFKQRKLHLCDGWGCKTLTVQVQIAVTWLRGVYIYRCCIWHFILYTLLLHNWWDMCRNAVFRFRAIQCILSGVW